MSASRLPNGGRIDRSTTLPFTWDGKRLSAYSGDSLASALLANDIMLVARSFKYHRPRGVMSAGVEESGALVTIGEGARRDPNVKATMQEVYGNLVARSQNAFPCASFDVGAVSNLMSRFFSAGFYYKTFMGPRISPKYKWGGTAIWMQFEKLIRRAAGMGEASRLPDPDEYEHAHAFCDVLVVGAGMAGLAAACAAARSGLDVWLVEQESQPGGDLLRQPEAQSEEKLVRLLDDARQAGVRIMLRTTAFGLYDNSVAGLVERVTEHVEKPARFQPRQRLWTVRARHTIIATGALERIFAFGNNDRPGVMSASAGRTYLNRYGVLLGKSVTVATNNDSAYTVAREMADAGAEVILLDARVKVAKETQEFAASHGVAVRYGHAPMKALGGRRVTGVAVAVDDGHGWKYNGRVACDLLLVSGGWSPCIHLNSHRATTPVWDAKLACFLAASSDEPITTVGAAAGIWDDDNCEKSGGYAGEAVAKSLASGTSVKPTATLGDVAVGGWKTPIRPLYEIRVAGEKLKSFIDPQHDVSSDDVRLAWDEGFVAVEHLKRYTTLGMATDGGKVGNVIGLALMAEVSGREISEVGTTVFRPPYTPVSLGALRGRSVNEHFRPLRRTPMHAWNLAHGAVMTMAGLWQRPWYFPKRLSNNSTESISEAYIREASVVRSCVGLCDVTSLGKIAVQGVDASEFLNRIYTNPFAKLPIGKARYGIMLRDDGMVMDDGTTWRLSESDYFMTTTTAHAGKVMAWLEELLQTRWQNLKVHVTSVSEQWAGCAIAGAQARAVLAACVEEVEVVGNEALPFMGVVETSFKGGIRCRIARISFSGEMGYEVYVPSDYATAMMDELWAVADKLGGCLYGLEALGALRIEKGHVTGAELDGRVTIDDAGLGKMASPNKFFIGSALRQRDELVRQDRAQLVGIFPKNRNDTFNAGAILCRSEQISGLGDGWITAVTYSPALGHWIGLGFIAGGYKAWHERRVSAADPVRHATTEVEIVSPHMVDPSGERMHG